LGLCYEAIESEYWFAFVTRRATEFEDAIVAAVSGYVAAFLTELILATDGVIIPLAGYFSAIQLVLRRRTMLSIADEVIGGVRARRHDLVLPRAWLPSEHRHLRQGPFGRRHAYRYRPRG